MRQFYLTFPNGYALRSELSWTHYRLLMRVENDKAREFYMQEAVKSQWSTRQLERQINSFFYERLLSSKNKEQVAAEIQTCLLYTSVLRIGRLAFIESASAPRAKIKSRSVRIR